MIGAIVSTVTDDQDVMSKLIDDAGPVAGLFVLVLGVFVFLLWRSMTKQLKKIDPTLPPGPHSAEQALDRGLTEQALATGQAPTSDADESPRS